MATDHQESIVTISNLLALAETYFDVHKFHKTFEAKRENVIFDRIPMVVAAKEHLAKLQQEPSENPDQTKLDLQG